jgi:hypothetical protein
MKDEGELLKEEIGDLRRLLQREHREWEEERKGLNEEISDLRDQIDLVRRQRNDAFEQVAALKHVIEMAPGRHPFGHAPGDGAPQASPCQADPPPFTSQPGRETAG